MSSRKCSKANRVTGKERIERAAVRLGHDPEDLLDWYREDIKAMKDMSSEQFKFIVTNYIENREFYRRS